MPRMAPRIFADYKVMIPMNTDVSIEMDPSLPYCPKCDSKRRFAVLDRDKLFVLFACMDCRQAVFSDEWSFVLGGKVRDER